MADQGSRRELIALLMECQTNPGPSQAGVIADWLEEFGTEDDATAHAFLLWLHENGGPWNSRVYFRPQLTDLNWIAGTANAIARVPIFGSPWAVIGYGVPITGWRRYRILPPPSLFVTTLGGVNGPLSPLVSATVAIMTLTSLGVPELPEEELFARMRPPAFTPRRKVASLARQ